MLPEELRLRKNIRLKYRDDQLVIEGLKLCTEMRKAIYREAVVLIERNARRAAG